MPKLTYTQEPQAWTFEITPDDISFLMRAMAGKKETVYLDYRTTTAEKSYSNSNIRWLELITHRGVLRTPYELIFDYRTQQGKTSWGKLILRGRYSFPPELAEHREEVKNRMEREGRLSKGNNPAPRVCGFRIAEDGVPYYLMERAFYYDQVGTNLSLDYSLSAPIEVSGIRCTTVRQWDIVQAGGVKTLPTFEMSRLANTVGVAVGVICETESGKQVLLRRKRADNVAVYAGMWHLPFSFALTMENSDETIESDVKDFLKFDIGHELAEELLGLESADFGPVTPLAFCRDLARGGKPQFFFVMQCRLPFEEIQKRAKNTSGEFKGKIEKLQVRNYAADAQAGYSPEFAAFAVLVSSQSDRLDTRM